MLPHIIKNSVNENINSKLLPVREGFSNVAKDIQNLEQFSRETRQLIQQWNEYFYNSIQTLAKNQETATIKSEVTTVKQEISELHESQSLIYKELDKNRENIVALQQNMTTLQQVLSKLLEQYNTSIQSLLQEVRTAKSAEPEQLIMQKEVETPQPKTLKEFANRLTTAEREVLFLIVSTDQKLSYKDLAVNYGRNPSTIKNIICRLKNKGIPLQEYASSDGIKRYFVDDNVKQILLANRT